MMRILLSKSNIRFVVLLLLILLSFLLGKLVSINQEGIDLFLKRVPFGYSFAAFVFLYVVGTFFIWYLKDPLKVAAALLFGAYWSTLLIYVAEIINAWLFFNISNRLGRAFIEESLRGRYKRVYEQTGEMGLGWIFLLRAVPLVPYRVLDITFGLSKLSFKTYSLAVVPASLPRIFWVQFILAGMKAFSFEEAINYFRNNITIFLLSLIYLILSLIIAFRISRKFQ